MLLSREGSEVLGFRIRDSPKKRQKKHGKDDIVDALSCRKIEKACDS